MAKKPRINTGKKRKPMTLAHRKAIGRGLARVKGDTTDYDPYEKKGRKPGKASGGASTNKRAKAAKRRTNGPKAVESVAAKKLPKNYVSGGGKQADPDFLNKDAIRNEPGYQDFLDMQREMVKASPEARAAFMNQVKQARKAAQIDHGPDPENGEYGRNRAAQRRALHLEAMAEDMGLIKAENTRRAQDQADAIDDRAEEAKKRNDQRRKQGMKDRKAARDRAEKQRAEREKRDQEAQRAAEREAQKATAAEREADREAARRAERDKQEQALERAASEKAAARRAEYANWDDDQLAEAHAAIMDKWDGDLDPANDENYDYSAIGQRERDRKLTADLLDEMDDRAAERAGYSDNRDYNTIAEKSQGHSAAELGAAEQEYFDQIAGDRQAETELRDYLDQARQAHAARQAEYKAELDKLTPPEKGDRSDEAKAYRALKRKHDEARRLSNGAKKKHAALETRMRETYPDYDRPFYHTDHEELTELRDALDSVQDRDADTEQLLEQVQDELRYRHPDELDGWADLSIRDMTNLVKKYGHDLTETQIIDRMAMNGNDRERVMRESVAFQEAYGDWLRDIMAEYAKGWTHKGVVDEDPETFLHDLMYSNKNDGTNITAEQMLSNPMYARRASGEARRLFASLGFLPSRANFMRTLQGRAPKEYSEDRLSEITRKGGNATRRSKTRILLDDEISAAADARGLRGRARSQFMKEERQRRAQQNVENLRAQDEERRRNQAADKPADNPAQATTNTVTTEDGREIDMSTIPGAGKDTDKGMTDRVKAILAKQAAQRAESDTPESTAEKTARENGTTPNTENVTKAVAKAEADKPAKRGRPKLNGPTLGEQRAEATREQTDRINELKANRPATGDPARAQWEYDMATARIQHAEAVERFERDRMASLAAQNKPLTSVKKNIDKAQAAQNKAREERDNALAKARKKHGDDAAETIRTTGGYVAPPKKKRTRKNNADTTGNNTETRAPEGTTGTKKRDTWANRRDKYIAAEKSRVDELKANKPERGTDEHKQWQRDYAQAQYDLIEKRIDFEKKRKAALEKAGKSTTQPDKTLETLEQKRIAAEGRLEKAKGGDFKQGPKDPETGKRPTLIKLSPETLAEMEKEQRDREGQDDAQKRAQAAKDYKRKLNNLAARLRRKAGGTWRVGYTMVEGDRGSIGHDESRGYYANPHTGGDLKNFDTLDEAVEYLNSIPTIEDRLAAARAERERKAVEKMRNKGTLLDTDNNAETAPANKVDVKPEDYEGKDAVFVWDGKRVHKFDAKNWNGKPTTKPLDRNSEAARAELDSMAKGYPNSSVIMAREQNTFGLSPEHRKEADEYNASVRQLLKDVQKNAEKRAAEVEEERRQKRFDQARKAHDEADARRAEAVERSRNVPPVDTSDLDLDTPLGQAERDYREADRAATVAEAMRDAIVAKGDQDTYQAHMAAADRGNNTPESRKYHRDRVQQTNKDAQDAEVRAEQRVKDAYTARDKAYVARDKARRDAEAMADMSGGNGLQAARDTYTIDPDNPQPREGRTALHFDDLPSGNTGSATDKARKIARKHAENLSDENLIDAYQQARADYNNAENRNAGVRNAYVKELQNRRLYEPHVTGDGAPKEPQLTPLTWGNGMERYSGAWTHPDKRTDKDRAGIDAYADDYVNALVRQGENRDDAKRNVQQQIDRTDQRLRDGWNPLSETRNQGREKTAPEQQETLAERKNRETAERQERQNRQDAQNTYRQTVEAPYVANNGQTFTKSEDVNLTREIDGMDGTRGERIKQYLDERGLWLNNDDGVPFKVEKTRELKRETKLSGKDADGNTHHVKTDEIRLQFATVRKPAGGDNADAPATGETRDRTDNVVTFRRINRDEWGVTGTGLQVGDIVTARNRKGREKPVTITEIVTDTDGKQVARFEDNKARKRAAKRTSGKTANNAEKPARATQEQAVTPPTLPEGHDPYTGKPDERLRRAETPEELAKLKEYDEHYENRPNPIKVPQPKRKEWVDRYSELKRELKAMGVDPNRNDRTDQIDAAREAYKPTAAEKRQDSRGLYFNALGAWQTTAYHPKRTELPVNEDEQLFTFGKQEVLVPAGGITVQKNGKRVINGTDVKTGKPVKFKSDEFGQFDKPLIIRKRPGRSFRRDGNQSTPQNMHAMQDMETRYPLSDKWTPNTYDDADTMNKIKRTIAEAAIKADPFMDKAPTVTDEQARAWALEKIKGNELKAHHNRQNQGAPARVHDSLMNGEYRNMAIPYNTSADSVLGPDGMYYTGERTVPRVYRGLSRPGEGLAKLKTALVDDPDVWLTTSVPGEGLKFVRPTKVEEFKYGYRVTATDENGKAHHVKIDPEDFNGTRKVWRPLRHENGDPYTRDEAAEYSSLKYEQDILPDVAQTNWPEGRIWQQKRDPELDAALDELRKRGGELNFDDADEVDGLPDTPAPAPQGKRHKKGTPFTTENLKEGETLDERGNIIRGDFKIISTGDGYRYMETGGNERMSKNFTSKSLDKMRKDVDALTAKNPKPAAPSIDDVYRTWPDLKFQTDGNLRLMLEGEDDPERAAAIRAVLAARGGLA